MFQFEGFSKDIFNAKYAGQFANPSGLSYNFFHNLIDVVLKEEQDWLLAEDMLALFHDKKFVPGGRILAFAGRPESSVSLMNCTTHKIEEDSLKSISDTIYTVMRASSRGQGIGIDISALRPKDSSVNNAAKTSTGSISFMELINSVGGTIGQEGRRAALLFSIRDTHPDLWRKDEQDVECPKCKGKGCMNCKGTGKIPYDFLHIKTIPGRVESANISVMLSGKFMNAVKYNQPWTMKFEGVSGSEPFTVERTVQARELYLELVRSAWASAEPGVLFIDNARFMSNSDVFGKDYEIVSVNPCGEQWLEQDGVCNLGSINLGKYVVNPYTSGAYFDKQAFRDDVSNAIRFLDAVLDVELRRGYHSTERQRAALIALRRVGLGVMGFADALVKMNLKYSYNPETLAFIDSTFSNMRDAAYFESVALSIEKGPCGVWDISEKERRDVVDQGFYSGLPQEIKDVIVTHGLRNAVLLSIAPTGSISNLLGASSGIEPLFAREYIRRVRMNGDDEFITHVHPGVQETRALGIPDSVWQTAYEVSPKDHVAVQAAIQVYIDSSISKTVNLPKDATIDDVADVYMMAWELGLKGISVYRDTSRDAAVLHAIETPEREVCPNCGEDVVSEGGCVECKHCGWARCS